MITIPAAPEVADEYLPDADWRKMIRASYFSADGEKIASSRTTPASLDIPAPGTWRIDSYNGLHGREIAVLISVPISDLELSEADWSDPNIPDYEGRRTDAHRYSAWLAQGLTPPPIEVVQTDSGRFRVSDGHRRLASSRLAGKTSILAWISPTMPHPNGLEDSEGTVIPVGMTFENFPRPTKSAA